MTDVERMRQVDAIRISAIQPCRDKRDIKSNGALRFVRHVGNHFLNLARCWCLSPNRVGKPGGVCLTCNGAVLTTEEHRRLV